MKISEIRKTYKVSQKELAKILHITRTEIIVLETKDAEIELTPREIQLLEKNRELIPTKEAKEEQHKEKQTSYEEELVIHVQTCIESFPPECKVDFETLGIEPKKIIASRIRHLRETQGLEIGELARQLDISIARYKALEEGRGVIYPQMSNTLSKIFAVLPIVLNVRLVKLEQERLKKEVSSHNQG